MACDVILKANNIRECVKEVILTQTKNLGRTVTHANACINKRNNATQDAYADKFIDIILSCSKA